jgi:hypothetical protein
MPTMITDANLDFLERDPVLRVLVSKVLMITNANHDH